MKLTNYLNIACLFLCAILPVLSSHANDSIDSKVDITLNVLTVQTDSVMGNAVARMFSQLILTRELTVRSSLNLREIVPSSSTREILLETPLREVSTHRFLSTQPRRWEDPQRVAEHFILMAQREGILIAANSND